MQNCKYRHVSPPTAGFHEVMRFPPDIVAHILGPSYKTVNHIMEITRCDIKIYKENGTGHATIKSDNPQDGNLAVLFVAEIIQKGRGHRFAGGRYYDPNEKRYAPLSHGGPQPQRPGPSGPGSQPPQMGGQQPPSRLSAGGSRRSEEMQKSPYLFAYGIGRNFTDFSIQGIRAQMCDMLHFFDINVTHVAIKQNKSGGLFAFIGCLSNEDAVKAISSCRDIDFGGRPFSVKFQYEPPRFGINDKVAPPPPKALEEEVEDDLSPHQPKKKKVKKSKLSKEERRAKKAAKRAAKKASALEKLKGLFGSPKAKEIVTVPAMNVDYDDNPRAVEVSLSPPATPTLLKDLPSSQQVGKTIYSAKNAALRGRVTAVKASWVTYVTASDGERKMRTSEATVDSNAESPSEPATHGKLFGKKALFKRKREEESNAVEEKDQVDFEESDDESDSDDSDDEDDDDDNLIAAKPTRASRPRNSTQWVRRSVRMPGQEQLTHPKLLELLEKCTLDDPSLGILKLKKFIGPDAIPLVIDAILDVLMFNTSVQALYIQNFNVGLKDDQLKKLIDVLKRGYIWTLNIGETYNISNESWNLFAKELPNTNVTHMYASEHTITGDCKKSIMASMRENRKHTTRHVDPENLEVIKR